jgi:ribose transport system permease protein
MQGNKTWQRLVDIPPVLWIIGFLWVFFSVVAPGFLSMGNLYNIGVQAAPLLIVAIGETLVILTEGIDLSTGFFMGFSGVCAALLMQKGIPVGVAVVAGIFVSALSGYANGLGVVKAKLPPFIVTLGIGSIVFGIGLALTGGESVRAMDSAFRFISDGSMGGVEMPILLAAIIFVVCWTCMRFTPFGRNVTGLGGNPEALRVAGVDIGRKQILVYAVAGLLSGIGGIIIAARTASGYAAATYGWDFDAIAAAIIGGASFEEGKGGLFNTLMGVALISVLRNGLNVAGVPNMYQFALIGAVVLGSIVIDVLFQRVSERLRRTAG